MGWRTKFVFLLIVYAAGFATAIYCLAPAPDQTSGRSGDRLLADKSLSSQEFAQSVNSGMHKAIDFSKEAATRAAKMIREKIDEAQSKIER
ncbi:MAG: hypothetical protein JW993_05785 [Sedimentisphaerales bacterium]|nr:hypothetical protein [Sedimentisphaerales bacterium]